MFVINSIYKNPQIPILNDKLFGQAEYQISRSRIRENLAELFSAFCSMPFSRIGLLQLDFIKWNECTTDNY